MWPREGKQMHARSTHSIISLEEELRQLAEARQDREAEARTSFRRPHSTYKKVVQGKCPLNFLYFNGVVCSNTLFSNTSSLTNSLFFRANSTCQILEHLVWSNTSGLQFRGPLARTNFLSALCGLPNPAIGLVPSDPVVTV